MGAEADGESEDGIRDGLGEQSPHLRQPRHGLIAAAVELGAEDDERFLDAVGERIAGEGADDRGVGDPLGETAGGSIRFGLDEEHEHRVAQAPAGSSGEATRFSR